MADGWGVFTPKHLASDVSLKDRVTNDWRLVCPSKKLRWEVCRSAEVKDETVEQYIRGKTGDEMDHIIIRALQFLLEQQRKHPKVKLTVREIQKLHQKGESDDMKLEVGATLVNFRWKRPYFMFCDADKVTVTPDRLVRAIDDFLYIARAMQVTASREDEIKSAREIYLRLEQEDPSSQTPAQRKKYEEAKQRFLDAICRGKGVGLRQYSRQFWKVLEFCGVWMSQSWRCKKCDTKYDFSFNIELYGCERCNVPKAVTSYDQVDILTEKQMKVLEELLSEYKEIVEKKQDRKFLEQPSDQHRIKLPGPEQGSAPYQITVILLCILVSFALAHLLLKAFKII